MVAGILAYKFGAPFAWITSLTVAAYTLFTLSVTQAGSFTRCTILRISWIILKLHMSTLPLKRVDHHKQKREQKYVLFSSKKKIWFQSLAFLLHLKIFAIDKFSNWDFWPMTTVANKIQARYEQSWQCSQLTSNGLSHQLWGVIYEAMISCSFWTSVIPLFLEQITMCPMNGLSGVGFS